MAQVDFTNAVIEPYGNNPAKDANVGLMGINTMYFYNDSGSTSISSPTVTTITQDQRTILAKYSGTFSASGTAFRMVYNGSTHWRVSNISFANGDSYEFSIKANLVNS